MHHSRTLILAASLAVTLHAHAQVATVCLRERVSVEGDAITLGQLAEIMPEDLAAPLGALEIGP
ncbi:MAG TPA: hypothetical protein DEP45_03160, partial [Armatimonadetes bacterium]|nr:hypothetical protein [Armatimonadota bacterium]